MFLSKMGKFELLGIYWIVKMGVMDFSGWKFNLNRFVMFFASYILLKDYENNPVFFFNIEYHAPNHHK